MDVLASFIPPDRRRALAQGETLPDRAIGAVLFADVSGFTPLTEAMTRMLGARRGAEELTAALNRVYQVLLAEIEQRGGSVVTFAGDAALCWFPGALDAAVDCAFALQHAMKQFAAVQLPDRTTTALAIKVTVAYGSVRRFVVGDPTIRRIDVLAGNAVVRTATAEHLAGPGEILVDHTVATALDSSLSIVEWRTDPLTRENFAVPDPLRAPLLNLPPLSPTADPISAALSPEILQPYLLPAVFARIQAEGEIFLTELRPVVAMFVRFQGIDFEVDDAAGEKLDVFIRRVQQILARYDGSLLELTIGDKGSYFYAAFGAPHAHEDDARRAVLAAREMFPLCSEIGFIEPLQIGLSQGVMRVGGYGSGTRRMYGAQGDEVNLAARLMLEAVPGTVLVSGRIQKAVSNEFDLEPLAPIRIKGKTDPLLPFVVQGLRNTRVQQMQEAYYALPMIGRESEYALLQERLQSARRGEGQIVGVTARAGMGKSRLTAEMIRAVRRQGGSSYGGECQSFGTNISYLPWTPIWRAFFGLDANMPPRRQVRALESELQDLVPERVDALPLLGAVLNLPIPENDFTRALEPEFRKSALHALLLDCVRAAAREADAEQQALLFVIEDVHWIDPASRELMQELALSLETLPVLLLLNYRPPEIETEQLPRVRELPNFTEIRLSELNSIQSEGLIRAKLAQHTPESLGAVPAELVERVSAQAQGNPFYIEQLLDYMHDRGINFRDPQGFAEIELPSTLYRLVLSRMDQLNEMHQLTLKTASIIGRWFPLGHLCGYFPRVGSSAKVQAELALLQNYDLIVAEQPEPDPAYLFKHMVTHQVAYESLAYETRETLHETYARFLETQGDPARVLDLVAYHYDRSRNLEKRREFLRRAGEAAAARFSNTEAVDYLSRALAIAPENDAGERYALLSAREHVFDVQGERERQQADLAELVQVAQRLDDPSERLRVVVKQGWLAERITDHAAANEVVTELRAQLERESFAPAAHAELELETELLTGVIHWQQGNGMAARPHFERALQVARASENRVGQARALSLLGSVYREAGDFARAEQYYLEQLPLAREIGDVRRVWSALNNLGLIAHARDEMDAAVSLYTEALAQVREIGDRLGEELLLDNLARVAMDRADFDLAERYGQQALDIARAIGDRRSVGRIVLNLGERHRLRGDYALAERETQQALELARGPGDRLLENFALMNLAAIALEVGDLERARALVLEALPLARSIQHRDGEAFLLNTYGQAQLASGEPDAAEVTFREALSIWQTLEPMVSALDAYAGLAEVALARGDPDAARKHIVPITEYLDAHPGLRGTPAARGAVATVEKVERQT